MKHRTLLEMALILLLFFPAPTRAEEVREWTYLSFISGNNSIDSYGKDSIRLMERGGGTTSSRNVVVQWASLAKGTQRLLVKENTSSSSELASTVVESPGAVDMGDWRTFVDFVRWGVRKYPAKHYFISIWSHGSGWHAAPAPEAGQNPFRPTDISPDDRTGHVITTADLGRALKEIQTLLGGKIDIFGADACLMAMAEVASEISDSVKYFVASEQVIPVKGWPYETFFREWSALSKAEPLAVARILPPLYRTFYSRYWSPVTLSVMDLEQMSGLHSALRSLTDSILTLDAASLASVSAAGQGRVHFTAPDYADLMDYSLALRRTGVPALLPALDALDLSIKQLVVENAVTHVKNQAWGVSFWLPTSLAEFLEWSSPYPLLRFDRETRWSEALKKFLQ